MQLTWLAQTFRILPPDADEIMVMRYARAYILQLFGGVLFADKSGNLANLIYLPLLEDFPMAGTLSWGAACLAYTYRHLCRAARDVTGQMGGAPILLQVTLALHFFFNSFLKCTLISFCLILQIWAWERFPHIAPIVDVRPQWHGLPLMCRWHASFEVTEHPANLVRPVRDAFDIQSPSQVCVLHGGIENVFNLNY